MSKSKMSFVSSGNKGYKVGKAPKLKGKRADPDEMEKVKRLFETEQKLYSSNKEKIVAVNLQAMP